MVEIANWAKMIGRSIFDKLIDMVHFFSGPLLIILDD